MATITIDGYKPASEALRLLDLRQALYDDGKVLMEKVLVNLHGDEHRLRRRVESKIFRRDFFRWYETEVFPATLEETIQPDLEAGKTDLIDFGYRVMANLTADFAGIDRLERSRTETDFLLRLLRIFGKAATLGQTTDDKDAIRAEISETLVEFDKVFFERSRARRQDLIDKFNAGEIEEEELPRDVLTELLRNQKETGMSREVILKEISFFLLAGAFTSIHSLSHATHEFLTWIGQHPEEEESLKSDKLFLQRCVHESMRLHPSSPVSGRRATCPVHLPTGEDAAEGDYVDIDLLNANRDTSTFGADAAEFNPRRELPKNVPPYGLSFGMGMHSCIGINLAAGLVPRGEVDPATHQYGIVTLITGELLKNNVRPDPDNPGVVDTSNVRRHWKEYPVFLG